ncbi:MAG: DUF1015 family protein [Elusimicrobia bacterium]|nr:DUF1015 family protein [Elusimicrobiota bacterium]
MVHPFKGFRFERATLVRGESLCLPYDCLTPELERTLRSQEFNAIHLEEPRPNLTQAGRRWAKWRQNGALRQDSLSYYLLIERFGGEERVGLLGLVDLTRKDRRRWIWPHEKFYRRFVNRRKQHFERVKLHCSPIFLVAEDKDKKLAALLKDVSAKLSSRAVPLGRSPFDRVHRELAAVSDPAQIKRLKEALRPSDGFLVADGHHRYRAASELAEQGRLKHCLAYVTSAQSDVGLLKKHPPVPGRKNGHREAPPPLLAILAQAKVGGLFPRKTTYFWPKVPCGLVYGEC